MPVVISTVLYAQKLAKGCSSDVQFTYLSNNEKEKGRRSLLEVTDMFITLIVMTVSQV